MRLNIQDFLGRSFLIPIPSSRVHVVLDIWRVQEKLLVLVQARSDLLNVLFGHLELLCGKVLCLVAKIRGFGYDNMASAQSPVQEHLSLAPAILRGHLLDYGFLSQVVAFWPHFAAESTQWTVGDWLDFEVREELD